MSKIVCEQKGILVITCKNCNYLGKGNVKIAQEIEVRCPICNSIDSSVGYQLIGENEKDLSNVDIPEFIKIPKKETFTYTIETLRSLTDLYYSLGKQKGISIGIFIGLLFLILVLIVLFTPLLT